MKRGKSIAAVIATGTALVGIVPTTPIAQATPAPEVEYTYNVVARRHYAFPNNDSISYGYAICDKVRNGEAYGQIMSEVKADVLPNDEIAANYLVSYAVGLLCPVQISQLRSSAGGYQPPPANP